jgi:colicin import membrane protein
VIRAAETHRGQRAQEAVPTIVGRKIVKSSGSTAWDETVLRAIDRTEVLPKDVDGTIPPTFEITFRPRD